VSAGLYSVGRGYRMEPIYYVQTGGVIAMPGIFRLR
jgi:hypothetical protein